MTRQDLIDATKDYLIKFAGLSEEEVSNLEVERLKTQEHREAIRWALDGGGRPDFLNPPEMKRTKPEGSGWRDGNLDEKTLAIVKDRPLPEFKPKTEYQIRKEAEIEEERIRIEERERLEREAVEPIRR